MSSQVFSPQVSLVPVSNSALATGFYATFIYFAVQTASRQNLAMIPARSPHLCATDSQGTDSYNRRCGPCRHRQATGTLLAHDCLDPACAKSPLRLCACSRDRRTCVHAVTLLYLSACETLPASVGLSWAGWAPLWAPGQAGSSQQPGLSPWLRLACARCVLKTFQAKRQSLVALTQPCG